MRLNYQNPNFDMDKLLKYDEDSRIDYFIIGDFSCLNRNIYFLNPDFLKNLKKLKKKIYLQLPLFIKEDELLTFKSFVKRVKSYFYGFVSGDLGSIKFLNSLGVKKIIYTTNVVNQVFSDYLKNNFEIELIRPLMYKRTYIGQKINFSKDLVVYGNYMLNAASFCFHSKNDLIKNCNFTCQKLKKLNMNNEILFLCGRSLLTQNRLDLTDCMNKTLDLKSITILDLNLEYWELEKILEKNKK